MSAAPSITTPEAPATLSFDHEPGLREVLPLGTTLRPGLVYAYILLRNIPTAEQRGFSLYPGMRSFTIYGQRCMLMIGGRAIPGGRDTDTLVRPYVDKELVPAGNAPEAASTNSPTPAPTRGPQPQRR